MPTIPIYIPPHLYDSATLDLTKPISTHSSNATNNPFPRLLQTPTGLAILEIQGKINVSDSAFVHAASTVGKLVFPHCEPKNVTGSEAWMKTVYLYVGRHQRLTGEFKKLPKAIGVVRKPDLRPSEINGSVKEEEVLEIMEIVEWKILFSSRPEPVGG